MTRTDFPDDMLMRYADGELDPENSAAIERAMETDDELVARVGLFMETRSAAHEALEPLLHEPVPEELTAAVERMVADKRAAGASSPNVVRLPGKGSTGHGAHRWLLPLAASLAAVLGGTAAGYWLAGGWQQPAVSGLHVAGIVGPALENALATVASGEERRIAGGEQRFRAIATFRDDAQALCREFEVDSTDGSTVVSVACRSDDQWRVAFAVAAPGGDGGYAPASSSQALDAYLEAIEAGPPMEVTEERRVLNELRPGRRE